jgi:RNA polymerase sigma-70 factor (ECF subfamily)
MGLTPRSPTERAAAKNHGVETWLQNVARGDIEAFDLVYDELAPSVYGLVLGIVRDPVQAEEVVQEVMLELWSTAPRFDPELGTARAWATTIAHRRAVDRVRAEQSNATRHERAARAFGPLAHQPGVAETIERRWEEQRLYGCIDALTELQRESVLLAYFNGLTYQQVAMQLNAPLSTVKTRIRDGLSRLRSCLEMRW